MFLDCAGKTLDLSTPQVMGVLNVTPDSFSDGGSWSTLDAAISQAEAMVEQGAAIIDIGGESTRPGAPAVSVEDELARVLPVIEVLAPRLPVPISIDTSKPEVMRAAAAEGVGLINDVLALQAKRALAAAAELNLPVCLMHMQGSPRTMQQDPQYVDVVSDVAGFLAHRAAAAISAGVAKQNILLDPGFGFGKTVEHNYQLLAGLERLPEAFPLLVGMSRKSMLGAILDKPVDQRLHAGVAAATIAAMKGAAVIRTHDVAETVDALKITSATLRGE
ncbi:MAG: dihydropteroate synthase [Gammaproteobacteria bacterium]|nr:dihydropteroate synthase [Gammaproteobacteria bacterium]